MNEQTLMNVYGYVCGYVVCSHKLWLCYGYISEPTHQLDEILETIPVAKGQSLSKQTMADDSIDLNATKELCDPLRTTHERE